MGLELTTFKISIDGTSQDRLHFTVTQSIYMDSKFSESWFENHFRSILILEVRAVLAQYPFQWIQQNADQVGSIVQDLATTLSETVSRPQ